MSDKDTRLLLREKDYELMSVKAEIQFQVSFKDPLINPPKVKKNKKTPIIFQNSASQPNNPLAKS